MSVIYNFLLMWLFDDLIKKSTAQPTGTAQTGGGSGQDPVATPVSTPIIIQKTSEESILTEAPVTTKVELPDTPTPITNTASDGESLLIVDENATTQEASPIATSDPLWVIESTTPEEAPPVVVNQAEPVAPQENLINTTTKESLHDMQRKRVKSDEALVISQEQEAMLGNLFSTTSTETAWSVLESNSPVSTLEDNPQMTPVLSPEASTTEGGEQFETPMTFIESSLKKIGGLIDHIDTVRGQKLDEAARYKAEKERNAGLEEQCYLDAEKMMREKAHAEKMRKYLLSQQDIALETVSDVASVETTLTTLSVKKSVGDTTDKKTMKRKSPSEEDLIPINT